MLTQDQIKHAVKRYLLHYPLRGILLVGSYARGYAIQQSDVDVMVFYDAPAEFRAHSTYDIKYEGVDLTIEHHDFRQFCIDTLDYGFNIGSLRMLLKVRDSIVLDSTGSLDLVLQISRLARLDKTVLLEYIANIVDEWDGWATASVPYRRQLLIRSTELLASLALLCESPPHAYSKPKWLFRSLRQNCWPAAELLDRLYSYDQPRLERGYGGALELISAYDYATLPLKDHQLFFHVTINDVHSLKKHYPQDIGPALRFLASSYYQFFCGGGDPLEHIRMDTPFHCDGFAKVFERDVPQKYSDENAVRSFIVYFTSLVRNVLASFQQQIDSDIGSVTFVPYFLSAYNATMLLPSVYKRLELLPHNTPDAIGQYLAKVNRWFVQHNKT